MLKKGKSSAGAVQGSVSSTTAHGVLPQYSGHATAALTPTIANKVAIQRLHNVKVAEVEAGLIKGENRRPENASSPRTQTESNCHENVLIVG